MTIKDISLLTGYSVGTVSRVLNDQPNVSQKARAAILEAAEKSGFRLNANAKQLKQQRSNTILVVAKGTSNELFGSLLETIQAKVASWPYPLVVDYVDEDENEVLRGVQLCLEKKPQGILFLGGNLENFRANFSEIDVPCVLVTGDASALAFPNLSSVTTDDRQAGFLAVEHLARLGHRNIAMIGGVLGISDITTLRFEGAAEACREYGLEFDRIRDYVSGRFSYADGYRAVRTLMDRKCNFSAIFAMADVMAIGAIRALHDSGLRVPEDVSVIGLDGLALGDFSVPRLATVRQSVSKLAMRSIQILREQIEGQLKPCHETIAATVDWKESTIAIGAEDRSV